MQTLIVYDKNTGNVSFTQTISDTEDVEYDSMITDVPDNRTVARVEDGEVVYADPVEIIEKRKRLEALTEEMSNLKKDLLAYEIGVINDGQQKLDL